MKGSSHSSVFGLVENSSSSLADLQWTGFHCCCIAFQMNIGSVFGTISAVFSREKTRSGSRMQYKVLFVFFLCYRLLAITNAGKEFFRILTASLVGIPSSHKTISLIMTSRQERVRAENYVGPSRKILWIGINKYTPWWENGWCMQNPIILIVTVLRQQLLLFLSLSDSDQLRRLNMLLRQALIDFHIKIW